MVVRWNLAAMMDKDVDAAEKLWMELVKGRAHPDGECTADEVEQEATWRQHVTISILNATAKKIMICARSNRLWNADFKARRKMGERQRRKRRTLEEAARAMAELQKPTMRSRRNM
jgi:hypothetical protein